MKLKSLILGAVAASSMVAVSTASPAQAASVGGSLFVDESGRSGGSGSGGVLAINSSGVDFTQVTNFFSVKDESTGSFAPFRGDRVVTILEDLPRIFQNEFDFLKVDNGSADGIIVRVTGINSFSTGGNNSYFANLSGGFVSGGDFTQIKDGSFTFAGTLDGNRFVDIAISAEAVPTPALLPGLLGMSVAALRKRKSKELESAEA